MIDNLLLSIGAMKSGTTWLYSRLMGHPDIFFSREKEVHYFSHINKKYELTNEVRIRHLVATINALRSTNNLIHAQKIVGWYHSYLNPVIADSWYFDLFQDRLAEKYCADFSNTYAFLDAEGWRAVRGVCESVRVLYTLRNPVERLWSHIKFHARFVGQSHNFSEWAERDFECYLEGNQHLLKPGRYASTLNVMAESLGADEYLILYLDDIEREPGRVLSDIENFLGIEHAPSEPKDLVQKVNVTEKSPIPVPLLNVVRDMISNELDALAEIGVAVPERWRESISG